MDRNTFDRFADRYRHLHARNIRVSGEEPEFFTHYKINDVRRELAGQNLVSLAVLDFGAGIGASVPHWRRLLPTAALVCVDVSERSLELAQERHAGEAEFCVYDGRSLPFSDGRFDVVFAACVFHHIDAYRHVRVLSELKRVLARDGTLFIFEHNPLNPLTVHAVNTCEFDADAVLIQPWTLRKRVRAAGFSRTSVAYRIFFPGPLRILRPMEHLLRWLPLGAQYRLVARR
jgi:ubiquinone/menaquinone biosynthesis C-methylase UbiE